MRIVSSSQRGTSGRGSALSARALLAIFFLVSSSVALSLAQDESVQVGGFGYWLLLISAALPLVTSAPRLMVEAVGRCLWVGLFLTLTIGWAAVVGDSERIFTVFFMGLSWIYVQTPQAGMPVSLLAKCYITIIIIGVVVAIFGSHNYYELAPGMMTDERSEGRVSFAGNVGFTGVLSLLVCLVVLSTRARKWSLNLVLLVAVYFVIFSQVRTAIIGLGLYVAVRYVLERSSDLPPVGMFAIAVLATALTLVAVSLAPLVLSVLPPIPVISDVLLQGERGLDSDAIQEQIYRPLLWVTQIKLFLTSPFFMGWGAEAAGMSVTGGADVFVFGDTVSLPTRLLSHYGLPGLLFSIAALSALWRHARRRDLASVASWAVCILVLFSWGSIFHPTDGVGVLYLLLLFKGASAFR